MQNPPSLLVQRTPSGLQPYGGHSAAEMAEHVMGQVYTVKPRKNRSLPRNSAYWIGLHKAAKATDAWPTASHVHHDLKMLCGYTETYVNPLTGEVTKRVQSTAFDKMAEADFARYFAFAQQRFVELMAFDPWQREQADAL